MIKRPTPRRDDALPHRQVSVEVVVPVCNEEKALPQIYEGREGLLRVRKERLRRRLFGWRDGSAVRRLTGEAKGDASHARVVQP